ncbi:hypothetical protein [Pseudomonas sp. 3A(2025)]
MAELDAIGVSVEALESTCEMDFRPLLPCWISSVQQGRFFKRLVVFEPLAEPNEAARKAWQVFQALRLFAGNDSPSTLALGILSTHDDANDNMVMLRVLCLPLPALQHARPGALSALSYPTGSRAVPPRNSRPSRHTISTRHWQRLLCSMSSGTSKKTGLCLTGHR